MYILIVNMEVKNKKMILSESDFLNYMYCPLKFVLSKSSKTDRPTYNSLLHDTYNSYIKKIDMLEKQNGLNAFKREWDKTCVKNQTLISDKRVIEGWGLLFGSYTYLDSMNIKFEDTSMSYRIEAPGSGTTLVGTLDPFIDKGNMFEVLVMSFSKTLPDRQYIDMKMKHTIDAYALKKLFGKDTVFKYHSAYLNQDLYTFRKEKDFDRLESSIANVSKAIENNLIYPRESHACSTCLCKGLCKAWTGKEHESEGK